MAENKVVKPITLAIGAALAGSFAIAGTVNAADTSASPFEMSGLQVGFMVDDGEGSCGEGSCGESDDKEGEGSCGEGSCGEQGDKEDGEGS